jgi:WD40 repeat protein
MLLAIETTGRCHRLDPVSLAAKAQPVSLDSHEWGGAMAIHPSSGVLLVGGGFGMTMWDMQSGAVHGSPSLSSVIGMVFSPDGRRLAVWDIENRLSVIDGRDLTRLLSGESGSVRMRALRGHSEPITALAYSPDGQLIGTSAALYAQKGEDSLDDLLDPGERHEIRLWSSANGSQVGLPLATTGAVRQLAFTADGRRLLSLSADGQLVAWDVAPDAWVAHLEAIVLTSEDPPN